MMGRMASRAIVLAATVMTTVTSTTAMAEPVRIQAAARSDFGRIVFNWNNPVSHTSAVKDGRLTVRFGRPIEASYGRVTRALRKYVQSATAGGDGQSVVITLKGDFDVFSFDSGSAIIVEIADKEGATPAPAKAPEKNAEAPASTKPNAPADKKAERKVDTKTASNLPSVRVRSGQHPDYTRLVFDWPRKVGYQFKQDGGVATLTFDREAAINIKSLQARLPRFVGGVRTRNQGGSVTVTLSVPATSTVKHFLSGSKVVMDIRPPSSADKASPLPPEAPAPAAAPVKSVKAVQPVKPSPVAKKTPAHASPPTAASIRKNVQAETTSAKTKVAAATGPAAGKPTRLTPAGAAPSAAPTPAASGAPTSPLLPPTLSEVSVSAPPAGPSKAPDDAVTLRFEWDQPVGAAVFRRAGYLWVAFDQPTAINVRQLREAGKNFIKGIEQMGIENATVLRMSTVKGINPSVRRDGQAWLLDFRKQPMDTQTPLEVKAQPESPVGARLFVPVAEPGSPIGITDPEVGDNIVIVPLIPLGNGIGLEYIYPQMRFLQSAQGLVIQPLVDDIRVRPLREGVELTSGGELYISTVSAEAEANRRLAEMKPLTRILDLEPWKISSINAFLPRKYELLGAISTSKDTAKEAARLDLIRFYFANGFYAETLAVLREAQRVRPDIEQEPEYRMLLGGAQFMMGRYADATQSLSLKAFRLNDEVAFWRSAISAVTGDITNAAPRIKRTGPIIRTYPKALKLPLGGLVTNTAIKIGDTRQAKHFLEILRVDDLSPEEAVQLDYQEGRTLELTGDFDEAVSLWGKVIKGQHRPSRAKAIVARMELLLKLNRMTRKEAIEDLEKLRFSWRGDEFEFTLLRRLGGLYLEEGKYRQGLDRLRQAATYFRTHPQAPQVTLQMSDAFTELYLNGGADALPPVTAIALYDEFKELTPAGVQGDEMIRKLADRLVGVDLLDRAVGLLESQVNFRLQGVDKSRVGTQQALVHILARDYQAAIKVLSETEVPNTPQRLTDQRNHLTAKSLLGLKQGDRALLVLKGDKTVDAELLRTEIYWATRQWSNAAQSLRRLLRESDAKPKKSLDDKQAAYVLNYAIALVLSGNERGLNRAAADFSAAMSKTNLKDAFQLISSASTIGLLSPDKVSTLVKDAENFQTFMSAYRARLKKQSLSGVVPSATAPAPPPGAEPSPAPAGQGTPPPGV